MPSPSEIRKARQEAGLTQAKAAELLGVTRNTWARYETGDRVLSAKSWQYWRHAAGLERMPFKAR